MDESQRKQLWDEVNEIIGYGSIEQATDKLERQLEERDKKTD